MCEDFMIELFKEFRNKVQNAKEHTKDSPTSSEKKDIEDDDPNDGFYEHPLRNEEKALVLAKDASTKNDDWFEIYDPRNPLNKRRRGEKSQLNKSKDDKGGRSYSHHKNN